MLLLHFNIMSIYLFILCYYHTNLVTCNAIIFLFCGLKSWLYIYKLFKCYLITAELITFLLHFFSPNNTYITTLELFINHTDLWFYSITHIDLTLRKAFIHRPLLCFLFLSCQLKCTFKIKMNQNAKVYGQLKQFFVRI